MKKALVCGAGGFIASHLVKTLKKVNIKHISGPQGVRGRNSDNRLIAEKLNWQPSLPLLQGLTRTYHWIASQVEEAKVAA